MARARKVRTTHAHSHFEVDTEGSWAISYGDMVTLLLTFFIMFFAADKFNQNKNQSQSEMKIDIRPMSEALTKSFSQSTDERSASHHESTAQSAPESSSVSSIVSSIVSSTVSRTVSLTDTPAVKNNDIPTVKVSEQVQGKVYKMGQRLLVEFPAVSFFKSGGLDVLPLGLKTLKFFYQAYQPYMGQYQLGVRAFTDTKKVRDKKELKFKDNLELSALRSVAIMRQLRDMGIPLTAMKLSGYGEMLLTMKDLEKIPEAIRKPASVDDYARTIVLVIEPKEEP
jgi:chemotaxis protein MotB